MRCLVTGGSGFIGRHVARRFHEGGHEVLVLDTRWTPGDPFPGEATSVTDERRLRELFADWRPDVVAHLAGMADARAVLAEPVAAMDANVTGTAAVLAAAAASGVSRVVIAGSCWVYNAMPVNAVDEDEPFLPSGAGHFYTTTMIAKELLARDFARLHGLESTVLRYSPVYGPGMWPGLVVSAFLRAAAAGGPLTVFGDGEERRAFLHVHDLAEAFYRATAPVAAGQVYNLEGPEIITTGELARKVSELFGGVPVEHREEPTRRGELVYSQRFVSTYKVRRDLGWTPGIGIDEGLRTQLAAMREEVAAG
ncbi:NAD-dependent epimerase/dehydratase family protein [Streptomyces hygroscopicus]|uniref:Putative NDP-(Heptose/hexose) epimerase/ dehydrogenase n=2 Tax=Streptomyces TaxID=1883 RepID=Q2MFR9_STRHY|nr:NAD-dependent epimerase/dehydratase family protein [Streptomyces hygroscopicus]GLV79955.1 UDP-glucose 4-epimerase [Streptomyces hygroscopicus subsp. hygroscopicus]CAF31848.1 putative NDP-(heptose/hexose) epimerase/ dehydrogenase [Streptomyces hygroscopicus subsp. hygroscopicus]